MIVLPIEASRRIHDRAVSIQALSHSAKLSTREDDTARAAAMIERLARQIANMALGRDPEYTPDDRPPDQE